MREININPRPADCGLLRLVGESKRVLELGCGAGEMSHAMRKQLCQVVGIDIDPEAGQRASAYCERVIVADLNYVDFDAELGADRFDVVVAAHVLEYLKDPASVLDAVKKFLRPDGYVVVAIPNIAHLSVRLALLGGKFPYSASGFPDRTQLRFFTSESAYKLLGDAGFVIGHFQRVQHIPTDPAQFEVPYDLESVSPAVVEFILRDPDAWTHQFILVGHPLGQAGLEFIQSRMKQLADEAERARIDVANLTQQLSAVRELQIEIESLTERAVAAEAGRAELEVHLNDLLQEAGSLREQTAHLHQSNAEAERQIESLREEDSRKQSRIEELSQLNQANQSEAMELRKIVEQQSQRIAGLTVQVETLLSREKDLREMLVEAHDELLRRDDQIAAVLPKTASHPATPASAASTPAARIRDSLRDAGLHGGNTLVISKGDEELVRLEPWCTGSHFPQTPDGVYAGYHPANGAAAIEHLEELRKRGAQFLLIPQTSLWWLDYYADFRDYLNQYFLRTIDQPDVCVLFNLSGRKGSHRSPVRRPFGVNVCGHIRSEKGLGAAVRGQIRSFNTVNVPIVLNDYPDGHAMNQESEFTTFTDDNPYGVNLIHLNADTLEYLGKPKEYFQDHYNIGYWAWETTVFPREWWDRFQLFDEIWVGSDFVMDAVSRVSPIPVIKVLAAIPDRMAISTWLRSHFTLPTTPFVFLFVFDFMSVTQRKNPLGLVRAFRKAFNQREDVLLVLKCAHSEAHPEDISELKDACKGANIRIIDAVFAQKEATSLMKAADCYVSLHRSEGFGLTMAEAMSLGKPVIATAYSGNMEFMTPANSYLVKYRLTEIDKDYGPYREGMWADPDLDHAAELMRHVFTNRKEARQVGRQARADILKDFSEQRVGALMRDRLLRLAELGKIAPPLLETGPEVQPERRRNGFYSQIVGRIHRIVQTTIPRGSRLLVVSKGDNELVDFDERDAWHFPRAEDGTYAGYHPSDGKDAIRQIEALKNKGCQYLLFPQTAFWWLDYYTDLQVHLQDKYSEIWNDKDCIIYQLFETTGRFGRVRERLITAIRPRKQSSVK